ncbi:MAG: GNAT family N-acetyltransferase [Christensenellales bacterium]
MNFESIFAKSHSIVVRPALADDYEAFVAGFRCCGPSKNRFDDGGFDASFMREDWYLKLLKRRRKEADRDYSYMLNIFRKQDGVSLGYCDITTLFREDFQFAKIGYTIHNPYWGNGYATECALALMKIGFDDLHFHRLEAHVSADNPASKRVLLKAGFQFECTRKNFILEDGVWTDQEIYFANNQIWKPN